MEKALSDRNVTLILVTHDRAFLEAIATGMLELDAGKAHLYPFGGNGCYDRYRQVGPSPRTEESLVYPELESGASAVLGRARDPRFLMQRSQRPPVGAIDVLYSIRAPDRIWLAPGGDEGTSAL